MERPPSLQPAENRFDPRMAPRPQAITRHYEITRSISRTPRRLSNTPTLLPKLRTVITIAPEHVEEGPNITLRASAGALQEPTNRTGGAEATRRKASLQRNSEGGRRPLTLTPVTDVAHCRRAPEMAPSTTQCVAGRNATQQSSRWRGRCGVGVSYAPRSGRS